MADNMVSKIRIIGQDTGNAMAFPAASDGRFRYKTQPNTARPKDTIQAMSTGTAMGAGS